MKITEITVSVTETVSLPGYNNQKFGLSLTADVDGQDWQVAYDKLLATARAEIELRVDAALEKSGESPKYTDEPLFYAYRVVNLGIIMVFPVDYLRAMYHYFGRNWTGIIYNPMRIHSVLENLHRNQSVRGCPIVVTYPDWREYFYSRPWFALVAAKINYEDSWEWEQRYLPVAVALNIEYAHYLQYREWRVFPDTDFTTLGDQDFPICADLPALAEWLGENGERARRLSENDDDILF